MSRRRLENLDPERQARLFECAAEEFTTKGYEAASLNRILEKSGMSKSSLYYYFEDKADLFTTLFERSLATLFKQVGGFNPRSLTEENYWSEIELLYSRAISVTNDNAWLVQVGRMFYQLRGNPLEGSATERIIQATRQWICTIIDYGQNLGVVRTDLPQTLLVDSTMGLLESLDRWIVTYWEELNKKEKQEIPAKHIGLIYRLLTAKGI